MRKLICASMLGAAAFVFGSEARAWGVHNGETLDGGNNMLYSELGWPDLTLGFQHGMSSRVDLGFRFSFNFGYNYTTATVLGMGMRVPIRIQLSRSGRFSFLLHFDPGLKFDSFGAGSYRGGYGFGHFSWYYPGYVGGVQFGIQFPLGMEFGIHVTRDATVQFGFDIPFYVNFTNGVYGAIPILFGPGFEYHVDPRIALGLNTKFGPSIIAHDFGSGAAFGLIAQAYFGYRL